MARFGRVLTAMVTPFRDGRVDFDRLRHNARWQIQQGIDGPAQDLALYTRRWPFALEDIACKVYVWHGEKDVSVIGYCFGGVLSLLYGSIFNDGPMKNSSLATMCNTP